MQARMAEECGWPRTGAVLSIGSCPFEVNPAARSPDHFATPYLAVTTRFPPSSFARRSAESEARSSASPVRP